MIVQRAPEDARVEIERQRGRHDRAVQEIAAAGRQNRHTLANGAVVYATGCSAFTRELRRVVWPVKFKPDLPPRYDGRTNPLEFLQLYTVSIQAAGGDDKVMANWFVMALKDAALSWLLNLPKSTINMWEELCKCFVANFKGTYERALTDNDLCAVGQKPGETLRKFIQRFSQVRNKIPNIPDTQVISAFRAGVTDTRMLEKLGIHDSLTSVVKLFDLADKCAKAEEGRLFVKNEPKTEPAEGSKLKKKASEKRKTTAVLAAEPDAKQKRVASPAAPAPEAAKKDERPYCILHKKHNHATEDCWELKKISDSREQREQRQGRDGRNNRPRGGRRYNNNNQQNPQVNAVQQNQNDNLPDENPGGY